MPVAWIRVVSRKMRRRPRENVRLMTDV
jgi:hypothetical protein